MAKNAGKEPSPLAAAAVALAEELDLFEQLAASACGVPLTSQRNLEKAARTTNEAAACQDRVGQRIHTLIAALNHARERNQATAEGLQVRGREVQERTNELTALLERFGALGQDAREVSAVVQEAASHKADTPASKKEMVGRLGEIGARMDRVVEGARELVERADAAGFSELARQADSLRQQVHSGRNKVHLLEEKLGGKLL